jgi:hypothetical protein
LLGAASLLRMTGQAIKGLQRGSRYLSHSSLC